MTLKTLKLTATTALGLIVAVTPALAQMTEVGPGEGELSIVAWAGYVERGETDPAFDWVTKFEASSGCKVSVKTANTSDEMVALMNEGGFDLVTASGDASLRLTAGDRVTIHATGAYTTTYAAQGFNGFKPMTEHYI